MRPPDESPEHPLHLNNCYGQKNLTLKQSRPNSDVKTRFPPYESQRSWLEPLSELEKPSIQPRDVFCDWFAQLYTLDTLLVDFFPQNELPEQ